MERSTMLVTSDGKRVLPEADEFFLTLGTLVPGRDAAGFAVRQLGFIKFQVLDGRITVIELDARSVDRRALLRAERHVIECGARLFLIRRLDAERRSDVELSAGEAAAQLQVLRAPPEKPASTERFRVEPQEYAKLLRNSDDPFCRLSRKWCASFGEFDSTMLSFAGENAMLPTMMIVGVPKRETDPVFRFIGAALFPWLVPGYREQAIGEKLESFPDKSYGAWLSGFYRSVASSGEPRFDQVRAQVRIAEEGGVTYSTRYERLLLPWRSAAGETLVSLLVRKLDGPAAPPRVH